MTTTALDQHDVAGLSSHLGPLGYDVYPAYNGTHVAVSRIEDGPGVLPVHVGYALLRKIDDTWNLCDCRRRDPQSKLRPLVGEPAPRVADLVPGLLGLLPRGR